MLIRECTPQEFPLMEDFLYYSIFQPDESNLLPRSIIKEPALQVYIQDFGQLKDDYCLAAEIDGQIAGLVWVRNIHGYGSIDDETPEFAISVRQEYRKQGIGTQLMQSMMEQLRKKGYRKVSLSVQKNNAALRLYRRLGFKTFCDKAEELIMICEL